MAFFSKSAVYNAVKQWKKDTKQTLDLQGLEIEYDDAVEVMKAINGMPAQKPEDKIVIKMLNSECEDELLIAFIESLADSKKRISLQLFSLKDVDIYDNTIDEAIISAVRENPDFSFSFVRRETLDKIHEIKASKAEENQLSATPSSVVSEAKIEGLSKPKPDIKKS